MADFKRMAEEYAAAFREKQSKALLFYTEATGEFMGRVTSDAYLAGVNAALEAAAKRVATESDYFATAIRALKPQP